VVVEDLFLVVVAEAELVDSEKVNYLLTLTQHRLKLQHLVHLYLFQHKLIQLQSEEVVMVPLFQVLTQEQQMAHHQHFLLLHPQAVVEEAQDMMGLIQVITTEVQEVQVVEQVEKMAEQLQVQEMIHQHHHHKVILVERGLLLILVVVEEERAEQALMHLVVQLVGLVQAQELIQHLQWEHQDQVVH
jgi:hypothetical protein